MSLGALRRISHRHDEARCQRKQTLPQHVDTNRVGRCHGEAVALIVANDLVAPIDIDLGGKSHIAFPSNGPHRGANEARGVRQIRD
ncbi:MAG TPA: hypothetical protein VGH36_05180 [Acetobacteraceae bacterium]